MFLDDFVQAALVGPELFVAKGFEAEVTSSLRDEGGRGRSHPSPALPRLQSCPVEDISRATTAGTLAGIFMNNGREDGESRVCAEDRSAAEAARNEAEQFRRLAEEARQVRDDHREALETIRQERERLRESAETARSASEEARIAAETARTASEEARLAADAAREAVVDAVRATADALHASLEQMTVVEEMRRTLREIRDVKKLDSN